jgi:hypothetical protein
MKHFFGALFIGVITGSAFAGHPALIPAKVIEAKVGAEAVLPAKNRFEGQTTYQFLELLHSLKLSKFEGCTITKSGDCFTIKDTRKRDEENTVQKESITICKSSYIADKVLENKGPGYSEAMWNSGEVPAGGGAISGGTSVAIQEENGQLKELSFYNGMTGLSPVYTPFGPAVDYTTIESTSIGCRQ